MWVVQTQKKLSQTPLHAGDLRVTQISSTKKSHAKQSTPMLCLKQKIQSIFLAASVLLFAVFVWKSPAQIYIYRSLVSSPVALNIVDLHVWAFPGKQEKKTKQNTLDLYIAPWKHRKWWQRWQRWDPRWRRGPVHARPRVWPDRSQKKQYMYMWFSSLKAWPGFFRRIVVHTFCFWSILLAFFFFFFSVVC